MPLQIGILQYDDIPFPRSLPEFQELVPDNEACANYLQGKGKVARLIFFPPSNAPI